MVESYDCVIIGAGPAGTQMAYYLQKQGASYVVLEKAKQVGSFFATYPRNRRLISINKAYCGNMQEIENVRRYDWNSLLTFEEDDFKCMFRDYSDEYYPNASKLVEYLNDFKNLFDLNIQYETSVSKVTKTNDTFVIDYAQGEVKDSIKTSKVFIATGLTPNHMQKLFETQDYSKECGNFYFYDTLPMDPEVYKNKSVLIIGGGNAAFETANFVNQYCKDLTVEGAERFAYNTHYPGNIRSINMPLLDSYYLKMKVNLNWTRSKYARDDFFVNRDLKAVVDGDVFNLYDIVLCCTGFQPELSYIDEESIQIDKSERGFPLTSPFFECVSCPSLYFIGSLSQEHDYKKGTSAFIHGFRYNCKMAYEHLYNKQIVKRFSSHEDVSRHIMHQINSSSALLHRFEFVGDFIFMTASEWIYVECLPIKLIGEDAEEFDIRRFTSDPVLSIVVVYLGYNPDVKFKASFRQPQVGSSLLHRNESVFIHPRFNVYNQMYPNQWKHVHTLALPENALNEFKSTRLHNDVLGQFIQLMEVKAQKRNVAIDVECLKAFDMIVSMRFLTP